MAEIGLGHGLFTVAGDEWPLFILCLSLRRLDRILGGKLVRAAGNAKLPVRVCELPAKAGLAHENALIARSHHLGTPSTFDAGHPQAL